MQIMVSEKMADVFSFVSYGNRKVKVGNNYLGVELLRITVKHRLEKVLTLYSYRCIVRV